MVDAWGWGQGEETWNEFCHQKTRSWGEPGWALTIWLQASMVWKPDPLKDIISALNESRSCGECNNFFALGIYRQPLSISQAFTSVGFYHSGSAQIFSLPPFPARWVSSSVSKAISGVISSVKLFLTPTNSFLSPAPSSWYPPLVEQCRGHSRAWLCLLPSFGTMQDTQWCIGHVRCLPWPSKYLLLESMTKTARGILTSLNWFCFLKAGCWLIKPAGIL